MRQAGYLITFSEANWMVANQSLRQRKTIPSNATIMLAEDVTEYLDVDSDYYDDYNPKFGLPYDRIKWLYWDTSRFNVGANGGTFYLDIETNLDWNIDMTSVPSWISIPTADRSGDTDHEITLTASENESINNDRTANIRMTVGSKQFTHSITQAKKPIQTITEDFTIYSTDSAYNSITISTNDLPITGGDITIAYRKGSSGNWQEVEKSLGSQPYEWTITGLEEGESYQIQAMTTRGQGTATVINYVSNIITAQTQVLPVLDVDISSKTVDADTTSFTFYITSNVSWSISDNRNWISTSPTSGSNNQTITVNLVKNQSSQRSGTITISGDGVSNKTIAVTQRAAAEILILIPTSANLNNSASSTTVQINSNREWNVENYEIIPSWLTVSPVSGTGNGTITLNTTQNSGSSSRNYTLTIQGDTLSRNFSITQSGQTGGGPDPSDYFRETLQYNMFSHACNSTNNGTYYLDASGAQGLANATVIYEDAAGTILAPMGYYSNGLYSRQWNGANFIGNSVICY